jgi:methylated-DNA-[protein]-cysteine S-methyltransferase
MTTDDLTRAFPDTPGQLRRLHERLAAAAERDGILDVAYRTVDSPVGLLLLAATDAGLVRVAYASEGHDTVLQALADRISPRILSASARLDTPARELDEYFTGRRRSFDLPLDWRLSAKRSLLTLEATA